MIPPHYFQVICCLNCKSNFDDDRNLVDALACPGCESEYPVIEGVPVLLPKSSDEVSRVIKEFYDTAWERDEAGVLKAKVRHEDLSPYGQRYIKRNEARFATVFDREQDCNCGFFLDVGSGAQPRVRLGKHYEYHICVDFSLDGLMESRKLLGDRAICVCASILNLPIKASTCDGLLASHVLYHIDKDLQARAVHQLSRVARRNAKLLIFYANPNSFEQMLMRGLRRVRRKNASETRDRSSFYYYAHSIDYMLDALSNDFGKENVEIRSLRVFSKPLTEPVHNRGGLPSYVAINAIDSLFRVMPRMATYVSYLARNRRREE